MIKKIYRLKERELKKVLAKWKPFFSYGVVLNKLKNKKKFNRFAIVISAKSVENNVSRNFFRRKFYDLVSNYIFQDNTFDAVFVVKKTKKLDKKNLESIISFEKDIKFLLKKMNTSNNL